MYGASAYGTIAYGATPGVAGPTNVNVTVNGAVAPAAVWGTPKYVEIFTAQSKPVTTAFGTPLLGFRGVAQGFRPTAFSPQHYMPRDVLGLASGFAPTTFGLAYHYVSGSASGSEPPRPTFALPGPRFGRPRLLAGLLASGFADTAWGTPKASVFYRATGEAEGAWGQPKVGLFFRAASFQKTTFGNTGAAPTYIASGQWRRTVRWGRPRSGVSFAAFEAEAAPWVTTIWGTPLTGAIQHQATPVPPRHRFGRPLLRRSELC